MAAESSKQREPRTFWYTLARVLLAVFGPLFFPIKYFHPDRINGIDAPFILVSNHVSLLDPLILPLPIKRYEVRFMGKRELARNRIMAYIVGKLHMIAVSRHMTDMGAMRAANQVLRNGQVLAMFPEGTRNPPEKFMQGLESGVSLIALRNQVPVLPAYIHGKPGLFKRAAVYYLPPLNYEHLKDKGLDKQVCDQLTQLMADTFRAARASVEKTGDILIMEGRD